MDYLIAISIFVFLGVSMFYKKKIEVELNEIPDEQHHEELSSEEEDKKYSTEGEYSEYKLKPIPDYQSESLKEYNALASQRLHKIYKSFETNNNVECNVKSSQHNEIVNNFDIRKAIIYSEIMTPRG